MAVEKIHGYKILGEISRGSMGIVYRGEKDGKIFAVKVLKVNNLANAVRLRNETAAIARLNSPHIVQIVDANEFEGSPYIVMELLEGKSLEAVIQDKTLNEDRIVGAGIALAAALAELHRFRMIHRDIKPVNIMVTNDGTIKLLDLGLAANTSDLNEADDRAVVGTLLYSSPEQGRMLKRPVDARSDLYSLGATLFECATGRPPFHTESVPELLKMHAAIQAPDIRTFSPSSSPVLAAIIAKLLEKEPDSRYQSADGLKYDFEHLKDLEREFLASKKLRLGTRDRLLSSGQELPLAGRGKELGVLRSYLSDMAALKGRSVIVEGEGGSGKSRLTAEFLKSAVDTLVLRAKCQMLSSHVPLAPIREAIEAFLDHIRELPENEKENWGKRIKEIAAASNLTASLVELSPGFREWVGEPSPAAAANSDSDRQKFLHELAGFIADLGESLPGLVLLIDDIQWMDSSSVDLLVLLAEHIRDRKVMILMTARNDSASEAALTKFKNLCGSNLQQSIVLGALTETDTAEIIASLLGKTSLQADAVQRIHVSARGNPFVITEYIRSLLNSGDLSFNEGRWKINQAGISSIGLSGDVFALVLNRIGSLHAMTKEVLGVAAEMGIVFELRSLVGAMGLERVDNIVASLQQAAQNSLVEPLEGARYRFFHDRIREAIVSNLTPARRIEINDGLAAFFESLPEAQKPWFDLARHYANGSLEKNLLNAARAHNQAGQLALANFSYASAVEFLAFALKTARRCEADNQLLKSIARALAMASAEAGNETEAQMAADLGLSLTTDLLERVSFNLIKMRAYFGIGRNTHAWAYYRATAKLLGWDFPKYPFWRWVCTNWLLLKVIFRLTTGVGFERVHPKHRQRKKFESVAALYYQASYLARWRPPVDMLFVFLNMLNAVHLTGDKALYAKALANFAWVLGNYRLRNLVKRLIKMAHEMADSTHDRAVKAHVELWELSALYLSGCLTTEQLRKRHAELGASSVQLLGPQEYSFWAVLYPGHLVLTGGSAEGLATMSAELPRMESLNNIPILLGSLCCAEQHSGQLGKMAEFAERRKKQQTVIEPDGKDLVGGLVYYVVTPFQTLFDQGDIGIDTDYQIDFFLRLNFYDHYLKFLGLAMIGHIRLAQLESSASEEERRRARTNLKISLRQLYYKAYSPLVICHWYIVEAGLRRMTGDLKSALWFAERGHQIAREVESGLGVYFAARERAKIYHALGDAFKRDMEIGLCFLMTEEHGWALKQKALEREFGSISTVPKKFFEDGAGPSSRSSQGQTIHQTRAGRTRVSSDATINSTLLRGSKVLKTEAVTKEERAINALTSVSLASTNSMDPKEQAISALDEIIRLFGAERAYVFLSDSPLVLEETEQGAEKLDGTVKR